MDFRTTKERLPTYVDIAAIQEDLILTFRNCCIFNEKKDQWRSICSLCCVSIYLSPNYSSLVCHSPHIYSTIGTKEGCGAR